MKEKKNIDNVFKEGFNNLEATPSPRVWENIQAELHKDKKERKVIPLWIKLGGVAALLALLLTVGNSLYNASDQIDLQDITDQNIEQTEKNLQKSKSEIDIQKVNNTQLANDESELQSTDGLEQQDSQNNSEFNSSKEIITKPSKKAGKSVIASTNSEKEKSKLKEVSYDDSEKRLGEVVASSTKNSDKLTSENNGKEASQNIIKTTEETLHKNKEGIVVVKKNPNNNSEIITTNKSEVIAKSETELDKISDKKKSIFDAIDEKDKEIFLEEKQSPKNRWEVAPNVAPVYYSSLGNGSSIDPTFTDNPQKGDVNMSYGVQVSYAVSNRLSVRTGLNNVDLSYSTSDIIVGTGPVSAALKSVDYGGKQIVTTAISRSTFNSSSQSGNFENLNLKSTQGEARLIQSINYYEIPVELKYSILDTKLGVNLIGGLSTLVLSNNEISVRADNFNTVLGEANNLSDVSFSTNIGLGVDYKISKKFTFNVEPMFKYQLNPYTDSSVNFKPYYLGVYSGISFKF